MVKAFGANPQEHHVSLLELLRALYNVTLAIEDQSTQKELLAIAELLFRSCEDSDEVTTLKTESLVLLLNVDDSNLTDVWVSGDQLMTVLEKFLPLASSSNSKIHVHATILSMARLAKAQDATRKQLRTTILPSNW